MGAAVVIFAGKAASAYHGKTDHPSDKRRRQSHQQRSADWRQTKGGVHSQLQRQSGADDHSGRGPF